MAGYIILGAFGAFGCLSLLWAMLGWLLPAGQGCVLVCWGQPDEGIMSRYRWLQAVGLLRCPLVAVVPSGTRVLENVEKCTGEALLARLEWERNQADGTGNGDPPGRG